MDAGGHRCGFGVHDLDDNLAGFVVVAGHCEPPFERSVGDTANLLAVDSAGYLAVLYADCHIVPYTFIECKVGCERTKCEPAAVHHIVDGDGVSLRACRGGSAARPSGGVDSDCDVVGVILDCYPEFAAAEDLLPEYASLDVAVSVAFLGTEPPAGAELDGSVLQGSGDIEPGVAETGEILPLTLAETVVRDTPGSGGIPRRSISGNRVSLHLDGGVGCGDCGGESDLAGYGTVGLRQCQLGSGDEVGSVLAEHFLHEVGRATEDLVVLETDEVGGPLGEIGILEQRCIRGDGDQVGVLLDTGHEGCLGEGSVEVARADSGIDGIFTDIDLVHIARQVVEQVHCVVEGLGIDVVMGVYHLRGSGVSLRKGARGAVVADVDDVGICGFDYGIDVVVALNVALADILVAQLDVLERERLGMAVLRTLGAPLGGGIADGVLDGVQDVLYDAAQFVHLVVVSVPDHARQADVDHIHCGGSDVFAELQEVVVAECAGVVVSPEVELSGTVQAVSDGLLPLDAVLHAHSFHDAAAGPSDERRLEVCQGLGDVFPESVTLEGLFGEKGYIVEPDLAGGLEIEDELDLVVSCLRGELGVVFHPVPVE